MVFDPRSGQRQGGAVLAWQQRWSSREGRLAPVSSALRAPRALGKGPQLFAIRILHSLPRNVAALTFCSGSLRGKCCCASRAGRWRAWRCRKAEFHKRRLSPRWRRTRRCPRLFRKIAPGLPLRLQGRPPPARAAQTRCAACESTC